MGVGVKENPYSKQRSLKNFTVNIPLNNETLKASPEGMRHRGQRSLGSSVGYSFACCSPVRVYRQKARSTGNKVARISVNGLCFCSKV